MWKAGRTGGYMDRCPLEKSLADCAGLSCEDENTIESQIARCSKAAMATVWKSLVCGVHDVDYREFAEGWHS